MTAFVLGGWIVASVTMAVLWWWHLRLRNAGIVDVGWTALVSALAILDAVACGGAAIRRVAIAAMIGAWGLRLSAHLLDDRVVERPEDGRYAAMRREWGASAPRRFFWFFQTQALAAVAFSLPALLTSVNPDPRLSTLEYAAIGLWAAAFAGEAMADWQLHQFKSNTANHGHTCRSGWWRFSRHPNYFFEWVIWVAYALFATASPWGCAAWACPAAMLYLLFRVTGIPLNEAQALRSRGDEYRHYQASTSAFVPWFPRERAT